MQTPPEVKRVSLQKAGYFAVDGAHLYTVLHEVRQPLARVLLVGPFASERHHSYGPWFRWAQYLAEREIEVLRYDYRGVGESTGEFKEMTFQHWIDDVQQLGAWLQGRPFAAPLLLHGLEMGALLAAAAFDAGMAEALLLWSPPSSANTALRATLMRYVRHKQLCVRADERRTIVDYLQELEENGFLEVESYYWSTQLWRDSSTVVLPAAISDDAAARIGSRPVKVVTLGRSAAPLVNSGSVGFEDAKDITWLFAENLAWLRSILLQDQEASLRQEISL